MITANWTEWVSAQGWHPTDLQVIPPPPRAFSEVFRLTTQNDVDVRRLVALVAADPVFAIRVLRLANVAAFAPAGEVRSIDIAVVRLGTRAVRNAVVAACLSAWAQRIDAYGSRGALEVQHAVGTACLSRRLAEFVYAAPEEAFVHGLLHDVGKLCLLKMRAEFLRLGGRPPSAEEFDDVSAAFHPEVGAAALHVWGLPETVRIPVGWHHAPLDAPAQTKDAALTYLANRLSHRYGFGCAPDAAEEDLLQDPVAIAFGLRATWLDRLDHDAVQIGMAASQLVS
jgi:HD-like signal output (HDOD) protein